MVKRVAYILSGSNGHAHHKENKYIVLNTNEHGRHRGELELFLINS